ncbi:glycoside hydrolase domain-containing protein [Olivibacter ginsenosidimutans]
MKNIFFLITVCFFLYACSQQVEQYSGDSQYESFIVDGVTFSIADSPWRADMRGNHRVLVKVNNPQEDAVLAEIPWRRPDIHPETKNVIVVEAHSGREVKNVDALSITNEKGLIAFQPFPQSADYYIYYLPYKFRKGSGDARYGKPWNDYLPPEYTADVSWKQNVAKAVNQLSKVQVKKFESRTKFDYFTSMGIIATDKEEQEISDRDTNSAFILFPEDRAFPIRLPNRLPWRWVKKGPSADFEGYASKHEFYVWQVGLWAMDSLKDVRVDFSDLRSADAVIKKDQLTCFNQEGTGWDGKSVQFAIQVPPGKIQALWNGVQIPKDAEPGTYKGNMRISADGQQTKDLSITIHVGDNVLADKGDSDLWRHARLRWLNSTIGIDSLPVQPYSDMHVHENTIEATGRTVQLAKNGLPEMIIMNKQSILAKPLMLQLEMPEKVLNIEGDSFSLKQDDKGLVSWQAHQLKDGISFNCHAYMEYDGYIRYRIKLAAERPITIPNIRLIASYPQPISTYFMGVGFKGGYTPKSYRWNWKGPWDSYWIGNDQAGLHTEFRGGAYHGPLLNDYKPDAPAFWANGGLGQVVLKPNVFNGKEVIAESGKKTIGRDTTVIEFALLITPVKSVDTKGHFSQRYYHSTPDGFNKAAKEGANIANIHHATRLNPVINYPFMVQDSLKAFIKEQHQANRKVKLYYTIRELTNHATELYALKSLHHEIFTGGVGYGTPWQMEHLIADYKPAWYTELPGEQADAALVLNGFSRWINYYLEGLRWMYEHDQLDGIYMDDVSFDRSVMKRMRKIAAKYRPDALIDLHSNTGYSIGPANQYTDFFPYVDRLWFGESFKYNEMTPDEWFVTFSGIPFGQMSDMLQDGGNPYLGMVYGATARHSYGPFSPVPIWKLWQTFGIEDAEMIGYWATNKIVETNHELVKATVYRKPDQALIAIGNFGKDDVSVRLQIDWSKLGFDPKYVRLEAPEIADFQSKRMFNLQEALQIKKKEGLILAVTPLTKERK